VSGQQQLLLQSVAQLSQVPSHQHPHPQMGGAAPSVVLPPLQQAAIKLLWPRRLVARQALQTHWALGAQEMGLVVTDLPLH
jgi:hypothetical protein